MPHYAPLAFSPDAQPHLAPRELEVLRGMCRGEQYKVIARAMGVNHCTVKLYAEHIRRKFRLHSKLECVLYALKNDLV